MELLRFMTAGNVDDGKSTLIGRLLYDSKKVLDDQKEAIESAARRAGRGEIDLSFFTDGLRAEREQGITIDVAYRYFSTARRKFIIADSPGHIEYTRNMVTAASHVDLAVILIDASRGITEQTRRHCYVASLLKVPRLIVAINKMDLVEYSSSRFKEIREEFLRSLPQLGHEGVEFVPLCALHGDCVVFRGEKLGWYDGPPLLDLLETIPLAEDSVGADFRFQVQLVLRGEGITRHYAGAIVSGEVRAGDEVQILPSGTKTRVRAVHAWPDRPDYAKAPLSVALELEDDRDVSRGDLIASVTSSPAITQYLSLWACWMRNRSLKKGDRVLVSQGYRESKAVVDSIECIVDMQDLKHVTAPAELAFNDVGLISLRLAKPMAMEAYAANRSTGALILVDEISGATVGAGMIEKCLSPREI